MSAKRSGFSGWVYRRTPQIVTAVGYVIGLGVLAAAAATVVIETTIMVSGSGTASARVTWITAEGPALVRSFEVEPGRPVEAGAPLVRLIDTPEQVRRAHYLGQLQEGLEALAVDAGPGTLSPGARADLERAIAVQAAGIDERGVEAPHGGWVVRPEGADPAPGEPVAAGSPLVGVADLERARFQFTLNDARAPTAQPGDVVTLLLADWDAVELRPRAVEVRPWAVFELPASTFEPEMLREMEAASEVPVVLEDEMCPARVQTSHDTVVIRAALEDLPEEKRRRLQSGRSYPLGFDGLEGGRPKARLNGIETELTLEIDGAELPESVRRPLEAALREGTTERTVERAWVGIRRTRLFARLFGK